MSKSSCYIGIAFHNYVPLLTRWTLVLSKDPLFMGPGWGISIDSTRRDSSKTYPNIEDAFWVPFEGSPANFDYAGIFEGVASIAEVPVSIDAMKALISSYMNYYFDVVAMPRSTEGYVVQLLAILRLREGHYLKLPMGDLAHFFGERLRYLSHARCTSYGEGYPVVSMDSESILWGHTMHSWYMYSCSCTLYQSW